MKILYYKIVRLFKDEIFSEKMQRRRVFKEINEYWKLGTCQNTGIQPSSLTNSLKDIHVLMI
jgi:hypothetical protein